MAPFKEPSTSTRATITSRICYYKSSLTTQPFAASPAKTKNPDNATGAVRACSGTASATLLDWLAQKAQRGLWRGIRLRQHRCACLHENVIAGEIGAFFRDIHVLDTAVRGAQVVF